MPTTHRSAGFLRYRSQWLIGLLLAALAACNYTRLGPSPTSPAASPPVPPVTAEPLPVETPASPTPPPSQPSPVLDPTGLDVVYTKAGELWLWSEGQARPLSTGALVYVPRLSPDGQIVAFLRQVDPLHQELWAVNVDGSGERRLVSVADLDKIGGGVRDPGAVAVHPHPGYTWLPAGGQALAFTTYQVFNGPGMSLLDDLHTVDAGSSAISNLFLAGWGGLFRFSPTGGRVAIIQPETIILTNPDGSGYGPALTFAPVLTYSEERFYADPHWSPDGSYMRVAIPPADSLAAPDQPTALWRIPDDGGSPVQEGSVAGVFFVDEPVRYSPDLTQIAYMRETGEPNAGVRELHLAAFDASADAVYASSPLLHFGGWSPDSRQFIYSLGDEAEQYLGSRDRPPQPLGEAFNGGFNLHWVDETRLVFTIPVEARFDLVLLDVSTGAVLILDSMTGAPPAYDSSVR